MVDLNQFANVAGLAILIGLLVQLVKAKLKPEIIPFFALFVGLVLAVVFYLLLADVKTSAVLANYLLSGFLAALTAVGGYEASLDKLKLRPPGG